MTKQEAIIRIDGILKIICPAYNQFQALDQEGQINEILNIFSASTPERQAELLALLGTSFQLFYNDLTQAEREVLLAYFGITTSPPPYTTDQEAINAVMSGKPSLYCYPFETEAIFWYIYFCYYNLLSDLEFIDQNLFLIWQDSGGEDGLGMNIWSAFIEQSVIQGADLYILIDSFTAKFRD
jgi:hypothetical protein